jgi:hypothetical protein
MWVNAMPLKFNIMLVVVMSQRLIYNHKKKNDKHKNCQTDAKKYK